MADEEKMERKEEATEKKKKKKVVIQDPADDVDKLAEKTGSLAVTESWEGTDRDYIYDELLGRVFNILRENNPNLAGDRRRTVMRPPQDLREGTNKAVLNTSWICAKRVKSIHVHQGALGVCSKEESTTLRWRRQEGQGRVGGEQQGTVATAPSLQHTITQTITTRKWSLAP